MLRKIVEPLDIIGFNFGIIVVTEYLGFKKVYGQNRHTYLCKCACGIEKIILREKLVKKTPRESCGCEHRKFLANRKGARTHGKRGTQIYGR